MSQNFDFEPGLEPERYEFDEGPAYHFDFRRRDFFKSVGGGIAVLLLVSPTVAQEAGGRRRGGGGGGNRPQDLGAWLHIGENGQVTVYTGKAEVGQNIRTSLTQVVAEELRTPMKQIRVVMGDTQLCPFDGGTFGSRTTPDMARQLRRAAAAARELLIDLAATEWKIERESISISDGKLVRKDNKETLDFGKLTKGQKLTKAISDNPQTTPAKDWKVAGQSPEKVNGETFVTGKHKYASDVNLPGMLHGKVLRRGSFGATLASLDTKAAEAMEGVTVVHDGDFVGVASPTELQATRALRAIKAEWNSTPQISDKELFDQMKKPDAEKGSNAIASVKDGADIRLHGRYTIAYIAHAPLEPRVAVAQWVDGKLTVWTGTQGPFRVLGELKSAFKLGDDKVHVIVPDTGSGYGGKHTVEAAVEAARLAKAAGKPVKVTWTREEEFTWAYFRPAGVIEVSGSVNKDGTLTGWEFHNYNSGGSSVRSLYNVPGQVSQFHQAKSPLRQGSYRALAATANHFARESHMDDLAHAAGMDPLEFRLKNLKDERLRAVLQAAAKQFGWDANRAKNPEGRGFGIAGGSEKGSYVATCAEVAVDKSSGQVKVVRAVSAFECGAVLNPEHLKNQAEGALVMGIGGALFEAIRFENGKILNPHFSSYRVPRFSDTPQIEVVLLDRKDLASTGAGETPIVAIAPAIGNAIFAATGTRLRSLPMAPNGVKA